MKREHHHPQQSSNRQSAGGGSSSIFNSDGGSTSSDKDKTNSWEEEIQKDVAGMDELLAVLGYKVKSSEMTVVAQKLEQLEEVIGNAPVDGLSQLASDTVHYNPSDLTVWLETMLSEFNPPSDNPYFKSPQTLDASSSSSISDYDLVSNPDRSVYNSEIEIGRDGKRLKFSCSGVVTSEFARPMVLVDPQENGIRLVHALTACAEAVQQQDLNLAGMLVKQIEYLAASQAGAMGKVATFFAQALTLRLFCHQPRQIPNHLDFDKLQMHFYDACPYLKFAHFTANQTILSAFTSKTSVHVIDLNISNGIQWPPLIQALSLRPGCLPTFRLTAITPPPHVDSDRLQEVGLKLAQFAETVNVRFEYKGFVADSLADIDTASLSLRPGESIAVNSIFHLHKLLAMEGELEKTLNTVRNLMPSIMTVVEQEADHNNPVFLDRFMKSLHYYSAMYDSLETGSSSAEDRSMSEIYLGKQISNVVASEGRERVERHEPLEKWRHRFKSAGFEPAHLGSDAFKQASWLLGLFSGGEGYLVEENEGCLTLGWHTRPLIAVSGWRLRQRMGPAAR